MFMRDEQAAADDAAAAAAREEASRKSVDELAARNRQLIAVRLPGACCSLARRSRDPHTACGQDNERLVRELREARRAAAQGQAQSGGVAAAAGAGVARGGAARAALATRKVFAQQLRASSQLSGGLGVGRPTVAAGAAEAAEGGGDAAASSLGAVGTAPGEIVRVGDVDWVVAIDGKGRRYYVNSATNQTVWSLPPQ